MAEIPDENERLYTEFLLQLAKTVTTWQHVEQAAYGLYMIIMKGANKSAISVSWFSIQSFDSKISLLDRCIHFVLPPAARTASWLPLKKRLTASSGVRNGIVHSFLHFYPSNGVSYPKLASSVFDFTAIARNRAGNPDFQYDANRLQTIETEFIRLREAMEEFGSKLLTAKNNAEP